MSSVASPASSPTRARAAMRRTSRRLGDPGQEVERLSAVALATPVDQERRPGRVTAWSLAGASSRAARSDASSPAAISCSGSLGAGTQGADELPYCGFGQGPDEAVDDLAILQGEHRGDGRHLERGRDPRVGVHIDLGQLDRAARLLDHLLQDRPERAARDRTTTPTGRPRRGLRPDASSTSASNVASVTSIRFFFLSRSLPPEYATPGGPHHLPPYGRYRGGPMADGGEELIQVDRWPEGLRRPVLILAMEGWIDAGLGGAGALADPASGNADRGVRHLRQRCPDRPTGPTAGAAGRQRGQHQPHLARDHPAVGGKRRPQRRRS